MLSSVDSATIALIFSDLKRDSIPNIVSSEMNMSVHYYQGLITDYDAFIDVKINDKFQTKWGNGQLSDLSRFNTR